MSFSFHVSPFFDNFSSSNSLKLMIEIINSLVAKNILREERLAKRAQVVIDSDFQRAGLYKPLISFLHSKLLAKYSSVFGIVYKTNPKMAAHLRVGWKIISEDSERFYVIHPLSNQS